MDIHTITLKRTNAKFLVFVDGKPITPVKSLKIRAHSPTGFNAGYAGSGPAQTALAIMLKLLPKHEAARCYQNFKFKYLTNPKYLEKGTYEFEFDLEAFRKEQLL